MQPPPTAEASPRTGLTTRTVSTEPAAGPPPSLGTWAIVLHALFGIVIPLATVAIETAAAWCAEIFFDPLPTFWHVAVTGAVPLANLALVIRLARSGGVSGRALSAANAYAIGVSAWYAVLFAPLMFIAVPAILFAGLGLLPLAPAFALVSAGLLRWRMRGTIRALGATPPLGWPFAVV